MSKYRVGIPCIEGLRLGMAFNNRLNDSSLLSKARDTYKDDPDIGAIFANKATLLNAITDAIGTIVLDPVLQWS